jgi:hypothetical protein
MRTRSVGVRGHIGVAARYRPCVTVRIAGGWSDPGPAWEEEHAEMTARRRAPLFLAAMATGLVTLAACGGGSGHATTDLGGKADNEATSDDTAADSPEALAIAAYDESWKATFRALDPPEETPELSQLMTGEALGERLATITSRKLDGHRVDGSMTTHPHVVSASSTKVVLDDCAVENSVEYDANNQVVDPADNVAYNYRVTVINEDGSWKVSDFERRDEPCTPE